MPTAVSRDRPARESKPDALDQRLAKAVGTRLRTLRQAKSLTIVELAATSGIDAATISRIETGRMVGTLASHVRLAKALSIDLPTLFADFPISPRPASPTSVLETRLLRVLKGRSEPELALALSLLEAAFHWVGASQSSKHKRVQAGSAVEGLHDFAVRRSR